MTYKDVQELTWHWHQHKTDPFSYPELIILSPKDYNELLEDCYGKEGLIVNAQVFPNKVTGLDIAIWKDLEKDPLIL
jgi:hypothetical protein